MDRGGPQGRAVGCGSAGDVSRSRYWHLNTVANVKVLLSLEKEQRLDRMPLSTSRLLTRPSTLSRAPGLVPGGGDSAGPRTPTTPPPPPPPPP